MQEPSTKFRKAELIELHDRRVSIHPKNYSDGIAGWSEYATNSEKYVIDGEGLAQLAEFFGLEVKNLTHTSTKTNQRSTHSLKNAEITVLRRPTERIGSGYTSEPHEGSHEIKELWASVLQPNLLAIRFVSVFDGDGATKEEMTQEITYSGFFTVWWAQGESAL